MLRPRSHPPLESLQAYALGCLPEGDRARIEAHVWECEVCTRRIAEEPADGFVRLLRASPLAASTEPDAADLAPTVDGQEPFTAADDVPPSLALHPRYRVLERLGGGGMGVVYRAEHRVLHTAVALKVVNPDRLGHAEAVERFFREAELAARLRHPNVVTVFDVEPFDATPIMVQEYVDGSNLADWVRDRGPRPPDEAADYALQAALGLEHAHEHGLVHRDIKPQNLLRDPHGVIKITDFGLARSVSQAAPRGLTAENQLLGSADYMAPEQIDNAHSADIRADLYSLGCTLYFLLTGIAPFAGLPLLEKLKAHGGREPTPLRTLRPDLDPGLAEVVATLMAKDPSCRYPTPADAARALAPFTAKPPELPRPTLATRSKNPRLAALATGVFALLMTVAGAATLVYGIRTRTGELIVSTDDPNVTVTVSQDGRRITVLDPKTRTRVTLSPGRYQLRPNNPSGEVLVWPESVVIERGRQQIARVEHRGPSLRPALPSASGLPLAPALGRPVDLLALVVPERDGLGGVWHREGASLISNEDRPCLIAIPYELPEEYDLVAVVKKRDRVHTVGLGLIVGRQPCYAFFDVIDRSGLTMLDETETLHRDSDVHFGPVLAPGRFVTLRASVRKDGEAHRVRVVSGDEVIFDWVGDARRLSGGFDTHPGEATWLQLRAWMSVLEFKELLLIPISDDRAGHPAETPGHLLTHKIRPIEDAPPADGTWCDLLSRVDPEHDALTGTWSRTGNALITAGRNPSLLALPIELKGRYELELVFSLDDGRDGPTLAVPIGDKKVVALYLGGWGGSCHALGRIDGRPGFADPTAVTPGRLDTGRRYRMTARVDRAGDQASLDVRLDGSRLLHWSGMASRLTNPTNLNFWMFNPRDQIALVTRGNRVLFHEARVRRIAEQPEGPIASLPR